MPFAEGWSRRQALSEKCSVSPPFPTSCVSASIRRRRRGNVLLMPSFGSKTALVGRQNELRDRLTHSTKNQALESPRLAPRVKVFEIGRGTGRIAHIQPCRGPQWLSLIVVVARRAVRRADQVAHACQ